MLVGLSAATALAGEPCVVPDNGNGTVTLPPEDCPYLSPKEFHIIVDGLPKGTEIIVLATHDRFICKKKGIPQENCNSDDGNGGENEFFESTLELQMTGTGLLEGFSRFIPMPVSCHVNSGPRTPGEPVQTFPTEMVELQGAIFGDPDFDELSIVAGSVFGLPSPGETTLTRLGPPGSDFQVDSSFDIDYRITFIGAPGGVLDGFAGTTQATVHMDTNPADQGPEVPTVSQWGLAILALLMLTCGTIVLGRRTPVAV